MTTNDVQAHRFATRTMGPSIGRQRLAAVASLAAALGAQHALAERCPLPSGHITSMQGSIEVHGASDKTWNTLRLGDALCGGDVLRVRGTGRAAVLLDTEVTLRLDRNTVLTIAEGSTGTPTVLEMLEGALHVITRSRQRFRVITPFLNATVDGTEFYVAALGERGTVGVFEGRVLVANERGNLSLAPGESAQSDGHAAPGKVLSIRPVDAVQWALHYSDIVDWARLRRDARTVQFTEALTDADAGRWSDAIDRLDALPPSPPALQLRAALLLHLGQVEQAARDIATALALDPAAADAHALNSVIAVAQNRKSEALEAARRAVALAPHDASTQLALSYAWQANSRIDAARIAAVNAVEGEPDNALAWARLAELHLSAGDRGAALTAARRAVDISPQLARASTILGFIRLAELDATAAASAFERSIQLDSADPLPRLGLGLATIHRGDLARGREQIEVAVSLDPGNAIYREYMGKAYYEEKRDKLANTQFDLARERDPHDPTALFYLGLLAQSQNRPAQALSDISQSMELNDDRVPYRSRLLLDRDQADRGAGLARIYSELGFDQLAFAKGSEAASLDPTSAQAHRFLADTYLGQPRGSIASTSELLQSQLLETGHVEPVQPALGDDRTLGAGLVQKVGILRALGPSQGGFNEYNPLFKRDGLSGSLDLLAGDRGTAGDQAVITGGYGMGSFSVGQQYFESHGLVDGTHQRGNIVDGIAQAHVTADTTLQVELRNLSDTRDQLAFAFDPTGAVPVRTEDNVSNLRLGLRQRIGGDADLIVSGMYETRHVYTLQDPVIDDLRQRDSGAEVQYLKTWGAWRLIAGGAHMQRNVDDTTTIPDVFSQNVVLRYRQESGYLYGRYSAPAGRLDIDAGVGADMAASDAYRLRRTSPRLGLTYKPAGSTTVRLAAFEGLHRPATANQTIEPTQIAGFNRLFDDVPGTFYRFLGAAVDQRLCDGLFAGLSISRRNSTLHAFSDSSAEYAWREHDLHGYLNWAVPAAWTRRLGTNGEFALGVEYNEDRVVRNTTQTDPTIGPTQLYLNDGIARLTTRTIPVRIGFFVPGGWSATVEAVRVMQSAMLVNPNTLSEFDPSVATWIANLSVRYRLPKRRGFLAFGIANAFDRVLAVQELDPANPRFAPRRLMYARASLSF